MPIYEYRCEHCGTFEQTQRITDPPLERCPQCRRKVQRLISHTSFQLKGSGWYVTDYARSGSENGGHKSDAPEASSKAESKAESKTESKAESKADGSSTPSTGAKPAS